ncbi:hypothetical protein ASD92_02780 [Massilia sp. Root1485]|nr:hypothetical protein ASD92_02780 [Massilia sp. Root1485]
MRLRSSSLIWYAWSARRLSFWCDNCSLVWLSRSSLVISCASSRAARRDEVRMCSSAYSRTEPMKPNAIMSFG